jgi:ubiquitin carboxyl-terminal hydrolase L3
LFFVLFQYIRNLGADPSWGFEDILGFESELLDMVSTPVAAVMLLFPYTDAVS